MRNQHLTVDWTVGDADAPNAGMRLDFLFFPDTESTARPRSHKLERGVTVWLLLSTLFALVILWCAKDVDAPLAAPKSQKPTMALSHNSYVSPTFAPAPYRSEQIYAIVQSGAIEVEVRIVNIRMQDNRAIVDLLYRNPYPDGTTLSQRQTLSIFHNGKEWLVSKTE